MVSPKASAAPNEPIQYGDYTLLKKLAAGGMAEVFLARQMGMDNFQKLVVVKRILPHLAGDDEFVQMFLNEARIAARFNHANICNIYNLGKAEGTYFIAMEFIHGEDLGRLMRKAWTDGRWIPMPLALKVVALTCEGLYYAHNKTDEQGQPLKVVHRDISPQNVLVSFDGGVKLVDFGIARAADSSTMTKSGTIKGKYAYMSPEQSQGKAIDHRTDIFALGLVLYELLTGVRPLKRENDIMTLQAAMACEIEPPSHVASVPESLDPVVMKALAPRVQDRYQSAQAFQLAIEDYLVQERLAASSVHLAEFMRDLFKDRLDEEARVGQPVPGSGTPSRQSLPVVPTYQEPKSGPSRSGGNSRVFASNARSPLSSQAVPRLSTDATDLPDDAGELSEVTEPPQPVARRTSSSAQVQRQRAPPPVTDAIPELVSATDDDDEPTSMDQQALGRPAKRPPAPQPPRRPTSSEAPAPRRRTGDLPAARPAQASRVRSLSTSAMPEAPRRGTDDVRDRDQSWKESNKPSRDRDDRGARKGSGLPLFVGLALAAGGAYYFRGPLQQAMAGRNTGPVVIDTASGGALLTVTTNQLVDVTVNGELVGQTPVSAYPVKSGPVRIVLSNDAMGLKYQVDKVAEEGKPFSINHDFAVGNVRISLEPNQEADVFLGKARLGKVPGPALVMGEGEHELTLKNESLNQETKLKVTIQKEKTVFGHANLRN